MLRSVRNLHGSALHATDGELGSVEQAFFDDEAWVIRYLVVKTGGWLFGREVLISPLSVVVSTMLPTADRGSRLTQQQVKNSPDIDTHKPVSRQHEIDYSGYYRLRALLGRSLHERNFGISGADTDPAGAGRPGARRARRRYGPRTFICAAPVKCVDIAFMRPTTVSAMSTISFSTTKPGPSVIWRWTRAIGGRAARPC